MLTAEMGAPVAANGHAAEIILGFWATALGGPRDSWADTRSAAVARNLQIGSLIMRFSRAARSMSRASARSQRRAARLHQHFGMRAISAGVKTSTRITDMSNANAGDNGRAVDVQQMSIILQTSFEAAVVVRCCGSSRLRGRKSGEGSNSAGRYEPARFRQGSRSCCLVRDLDTVAESRTGAAGARARIRRRFTSSLGPGTQCPGVVLRRQECGGMLRGAVRRPRTERRRRLPLQLGLHP